MSQPKFREMVARVREHLLDTSTPYRYPTSYICEGIVEGLRLLHNIRPESRYCGLTLVSMDYPSITSPTDETDETLGELLDSELHIDPRWESAIRYFAQGKCYEVDSADTANQTRAE